MISKRSEASQRVAGLDLLKSVAILLIVFFHYNNIDIDIVGWPCFETYLNYALYSWIAFSIPLLFLVNGALVMNRPFDARKLVARAARMAALSVLWGVITLGGMMALKGDAFALKDFLRDLLQWKQGYINHLWFLQTLAMAYVVLLIAIPQFQSRTQGARWFSIIVFGLVFGEAFLQAAANGVQHALARRLIAVDYPFANVFHPFTGRLGYALAYLLLGGWLYAARERLLRRKYRWIALAALLCGWVFLTLFGVFESRMNGTRYIMTTREFSSIYAAVASAGLFLLALPYRGNGFLGRVVAFVGRNTLTVYLLHRFFGVLIWEKLPVPTNNILFNLAVSCASVLLCAALGEGLRRVPVLKRLFIL